MNKEEKQITKEQRNTAIRRLRSRGLKYEEISSRLKVSHGTIVNILNDYPYSTKSENSEIIELAERTDSPLDKQEGGTHYSLPIQPIEYIVKNNIGYIEGNVIKYVTRHRQKNGVEDIKKAIHYLELLLHYHD